MYVLFALAFLRAIFPSGYVQAAWWDCGDAAVYSCVLVQTGISSVFLLLHWAMNSRDSGMETLTWEGGSC